MSKDGQQKPGVNKALEALFRIYADLIQHGGSEDACLKARKAIQTESDKTDRK